jgi:DNA mismatch repair protein MutL
MPIRKLPPLLVNQIAAGEVIERPASVVKELVENSLDAGGTRVEVAIENGGIDLIRVGDDGKGIAPEELPLAVAPHATSKLQSAEQLAAISTLGFRGEALASIASVSRLRVSSRAMVDGRLAEAGAAVEASGDRVSEVMPAGCAPGTVLEVRDLFFNTPARRKFMRSASTEFGHISELLSRVAMVHHRVGFKLSHNGRVTLDLPSGQSRARRCLEVLGKELEEGMLEFEHRNTPSGDASAGAGTGAMTIWGLAGVPSIARPTAKFQYLCVNGRPIKDRNVQHAIREAYRGLIPPDRHPMVVVFLEVDPHAVDVNVHPTKSEVRFRHPQSVHGLVLSSLRQRLLGADLTPTMSQSGWRGGSFSIETTATASPSPPEAHSPPQPARPATVNEFVDYFRRMAPTQKTFAFDEVRRAMHEDSLLAATSSDDDDAGPNGSGSSGGASGPPPNLPGVAPLSILQVHQSYVVTEDDDGLIIVDQHALHERVMFEELRRRVLGGPGKDGKPAVLESQRLLMPAMIPADTRRQAMIEELRPLLDRLGIEAEPMGPSTIGVQAFPSFLFDRGVEPEEFLADLFDRVEEGQIDPADASSEEAALSEVLDMMACKAAVKAGDKMTQQELAALLARRDEIERSSNCPHGRPTTIRLTLRDLEKQFKRT